MQREAKGPCSEQAMTAAEGVKGRQFAAACCVLSSYVKNTAAAAQARPAALSLMPGADLSVQEEQHEAAPAQMTILYGGRVLVVDDLPADRAAELLCIAAEAHGAGRRRGELAADDLPMARKASLQRFMEKRKGRFAARGVLPYRRPHADHLKLAL